MAEYKAFVGVGVLEATSQQALMGQVPTFHSTEQCLNSSFPPKHFPQALKDCAHRARPGTQGGSRCPGAPNLETTRDPEGMP